MHIFLGILSTIGFILLIILFVILALIALILFFPVVYRAKIVKKEKLTANGSVKWLFGVIYFGFFFENAEFKYIFRVFGIPVIKKLPDKTPKNISKPEEHSEDVAGEEVYERAKKQPTIKPGEIIRDETGQAEKKIKIEISEEQLKNDDTETKTPFTDKIKFKLKDIYDKLKKVRNVLDLIGKIKAPLIGMLKSVLPKKVKGYISFDFEDPSKTGMLYALLGALCIPVPKDLELVSEFKEKKFECDVTISGSIFIIILIVNIIKIFMIPEFRELIGLKKSGNEKKPKHSRKKTMKYNAKIKQGGRHG